MRVIIFGATGMVGHGALHECLGDPEVERVVSVVRAPSGRQYEKLREIVHKDLLDFRPIESKLTGFDRLLRMMPSASTEFSRLTTSIEQQTGWMSRG